MGIDFPTGSSLGSVSVCPPDGAGIGHGQKGAFGTSVLQLTEVSELGVPEHMCYWNAFTHLSIAHQTDGTPAAGWRQPSESRNWDLVEVLKKHLLIALAIIMSTRIRERAREP